MIKKYIYNKRLSNEKENNNKDNIKTIKRSPR